MGSSATRSRGRILDAIGLLSELPIFIDDTPIQGIVEMRGKSRRLQAERGLDLLVVDYLQLMSSASGRSDNRVQEMGEFSRSLKGMARDLDIPVIACSQLSRAPEQRPSHRPILSDLRESGSIEQDADVVAFIYREDVYTSREDWERTNPRSSIPTAWPRSSSRSIAMVPPATCPSIFARMSYVSRTSTSPWRRRSSPSMAGAGFPSRVRSTPVPNPLLGPILEQIDDIAELKCTLRLVKLLHEKKGFPRSVSHAELLADPVLAKGLAADPGGPRPAVERGMRLAVKRGVFIQVGGEQGRGGGRAYLLNTEANRRTVAQRGVGAGPGPADDLEPFEGPFERPNIFAVYEDNVGVLNPMIAEELKDAEERYPRTGSRTRSGRP